MSLLLKILSPLLINFNSRQWSLYGLFGCWWFIYQHPISWNYWYLRKETFSNSETLVKGMFKNDFRELLNLVTKESFFTFNNKFYIQVDGVAMGSPLVPILANIFLSHYEENWLNKCPIKLKRSFYRKYVHNVFVLFE